MNIVVREGADFERFAIRSAFEDRCKQFVERLNWTLNVTADGQEIDQYDDGNCQYFLAMEDRRHVASCRIRRFDHGTMLFDHFKLIFPEAKTFFRSQTGTFYELTRLCRSPAETVELSSKALAALGSELNDFKYVNNVVGFVAIVFRSVARLLKARRVCYMTLGVSEKNNTLIYLICITGFPETERTFSCDLPSVRASVTARSSPTSLTEKSTVLVA